MKTGCVILNYNDYENTTTLVSSIIEYELLDLIIIVDNCSPDHSGIRLSELYANEKKVIVLLVDNNKGYAAGNNYGVKYLFEKGYDYAVICNPDVVFDNHFVSRCCATLNKGISLTSGVMKGPDNHYSSIQTYTVHSYYEDLMHCFLLGRKVLDKKYKRAVKSNDENQILEVNRIPGSLMAVNVRDFIQVGGFDENTFLYCEEKIFCERLIKAGKKIALLPGIEYLHNESQTINKRYNVHQKIHLFVLSNNYYYRTYKNIGMIKYCILQLCEGCYELEFLIRDLIYRYL